MLVTVYAENDGYVEGRSATYTTARSTASTAHEDASPVIGQTNNSALSGQYGCFESFLSFDLSALGTYGGPAYHIVDCGSLFLKVNGDPAVTALTPFTLDWQVHDWGTSLATGDWVAGASLSSTVLWSAYSSDAVDGEYLEFTAVADPQPLRAYIETTTPNNLRLLGYSSRHKAGSSPSGHEYLIFHSAATAGTTSDPYVVLDYVEHDVTEAGNLTGALGPVTLWPRVLDSDERQTVKALGMAIIERALDSGPAVIEGDVRTAAGTVVPATHVRAGWWIKNLDYLPDSSDKPRPLLIQAHSVDLKGGKAALTVGTDWMERELGVRMVDLLAMPEPQQAEPVQDVAEAPYLQNSGAQEDT